MNTPNRQDETAARRYYWAKYHSAEKTREFVEGPIRLLLVLVSMVPGYLVMVEIGMGLRGWLAGSLVFAIIFVATSLPITWVVRRRRDNALIAARDNGVEV